MNERGTSRRRLIVTPTPTGMTPSINQLESNIIQEQTYWDSPEAVLLFGRRNDTNIDVEDAVDERIAMMEKANESSSGWQLVMDDFDSKDMMSNHDIFMIQNKAKYLLLALKFAKTNMPTMNWKTCCEEAIKV